MNQAILVVEFHIQHAHVAAFDTAIRENARLSVANERGCQQFDVCTDAQEPGLFYLYEVYDDDAALQAHLASPHFLAMDALTATWVERKRVRRLVRAAP
jgi:quinol monooxygenase YgiN